MTDDEKAVKSVGESNNKAESGLNDSTKNEVKTQLWRLVSHPSIIVLAGNNENEAALATNWWKIPAEQMPDYYNQFRDLYIGTIRKTILDEGIILPFVSSSPTNGIERMGF